MKKTSVILTKAQVDFLLGLISDAQEKARREGHRGGATLKAVSEKLWDAYANTHPEEGPFK